MTEPMRRGTGYRPSPHDQRDYPARAFIPRAGAQVYPDEYRLPFSRPVRDQGASSMCVDYSLTVMAELMHQVERGTPVTLGTGYLYGRRDEDDYQDEGMVPREALDAFRRAGPPPADVFNVTGTYQQCRAAVAARQAAIDAAGRPQRIASYVRCYSPRDVQGALYNLKSPVMLGIIASLWFMTLTPRTGVVRNEPPETFANGHPHNLGGHAMVIVGWRRIGDHTYWIVQNSWGPSWGDRGYCYIPWDYNGIWEMWAVTDARPSGRYLRLPIGEGRMELRWPQADGTERTEVRTIDVGAHLVDGRTVLPVRHVTDGLTALLQGLEAVPRATIPLPNVDPYGKVVSVDVIIPDSEVGG